MTCPGSHSWCVLEAGIQPGALGPDAPGPATSPSHCGRAGPWPRGPPSPSQGAFRSAPGPRPRAGVLGSSTQVELGSWGLGLSGRQGAGWRQIPGTEGLCLPADGQGPTGCKLIRQMCFCQGDGAIRGPGSSREVEAALRELLSGPALQRGPLPGRRLPSLCAGGCQQPHRHGLNLLRAGLGALLALCPLAVQLPWEAGVTGSSASCIHSAVLPSLDRPLLGAH